MCRDSPLAGVFCPGQHSNCQRWNRVSHGSAVMASSGRIAAFQLRSEEEVQVTTVPWKRHAHQRAHDFFKTDEMLDRVLTQLAKGMDKREDAILSSDDTCVHWYGDTSADGDMHPTLRMVKPGDTTESEVFVSRLLPFIFAGDDSFELLMQLPKMPFRMRCGDPLCINFFHISPGV
mmetsp:Transcript_113819/g.284714  ORF Transcript_113819/g.284714 Transcript_113819/m.284714 type:complete len:176 (+) Transcript_113819:154-681(+)